MTQIYLHFVFASDLLTSQLTLCITHQTMPSCRQRVFQTEPSLPQLHETTVARSALPTSPLRVACFTDHAAARFFRTTAATAAAAAATAGWDPVFEVRKCDRLDPRTVSLALLSKYRVNRSPKYRRARSDLQEYRYTNRFFCFSPERATGLVLTVRFRFDSVISARKLRR